MECVYKSGKVSSFVQKLSKTKFTILYINSWIIEMTRKLNVSTWIKKQNFVQKDFSLDEEETQREKRCEKWMKKMSILKIERRKRKELAGRDINWIREGGVSSNCQPTRQTVNTHTPSSSSSNTTRPPPLTHIFLYCQHITELCVWPLAGLPGGCSQNTTHPRLTHTHTHSFTTRNVALC